LKASGPMEVISGTGRTIDRTKEAWLCRCGASKNKPYCDGSHKAIGFAAD
jgi:CDGSH-type Zn-finger protein